MIGVTVAVAATLSIDGDAWQVRGEPVRGEVHVLGLLTADRSRRCWAVLGRWFSIEHGRDVVRTLASSKIHALCVESEGVLRNEGTSILKQDQAGALELKDGELFIQRRRWRWCRELFVDDVEGWLRVPTLRDPDEYAPAREVLGQVSVDCWAVREDFDLASLGSYQGFRDVGVVCRDGAGGLQVRTQRSAGRTAWSARDIVAAQHPTKPRPLQKRGALLPVKLEGTKIYVGEEVWHWGS